MGAVTGWIPKAQAIISSKAFVWCTLTLYALLAIYFALMVPIPHYSLVRNGIPIVSEPSLAPDEFRHIANVLYYARMNLFAGPVIDSATVDSLRLGEITRFPSYFYYYFLSFFVRWFDFSANDYPAAVLTLRALTAAFGMLTLLVIRKTLLKLNFSMAIANLSVLGLVLTGRFVWQSVAVSYDLPSMLLFVIFCYYSIKLIQTRQLWLALPLLTVAFLNAIVKYTFLPFELSYLAIIAIWLFATRKRDPMVTAPTNSHLQLWLWLIGGLITFALFAERILQNLFRWGKIEPSCSQIQSFDACYRGFGIFRRNTNAAQLVADGQAPDLMNPLSYLIKWLHNMYQSLFFYRGWGTNSWHLSWHVSVIGLVVTAIVLGLFAFSLFSRKHDAARWFAILVTVSYLGGVFAFNARTYINLHQTYAAAGRYLLPVFGFLFAFALLGLKRLLQVLPSWSAKSAVYALTVLALLFVWWHNPVVAFEPNIHKDAYYEQGGSLLEFLHAITNVKR